MDDSTVNEDNEESAIETYHKARKIFKAGGFELIKWASNSPKLISAIPKDLAETEEGPDGVISKAQKMLGISYIPREDVFSFHEYHKLAANMVDTKMKLTSCLPKIFSPNVLILPIIMEGRRCLSMAREFSDRENKPLSWHTVFESPFS